MLLHGIYRYVYEFLEVIFFVNMNVEPMPRSASMITVFQRSTPFSERSEVYQSKKQIK